MSQQVRGVIVSKEIKPTRTGGSLYLVNVQEPNGAQNTYSTFDGGLYSAAREGATVEVTYDVRFNTRGGRTYENRNLLDLVVFPASQGQVRPAPPAPVAGRVANGSIGDGGRQESIIRQSSLKASLDFVGLILSKDLLEKKIMDSIKKDSEVLYDMVAHYAKRFRFFVSQEEPWDKTGIDETVDEQSDEVL